MVRAAFLLLGGVVASAQDVLYFRNNNHDKETALDISSDADSVVLREWNNASFRIFDSPADITVQRMLVSGAPKSTVTLYPSPAHLSLASGPMYILSNASTLTIEDAKTGSTYPVSYTDTIAWVSQGACLRFSVELGDTGVASLMTVRSGDVTKASDTCTAAGVLVGTEGLRDNNVPYELTPSNTCARSGTHMDTPGYSNLDEPIGPLDPHYHTRGAIYYVQYGYAKFNDAGVEDDFITDTELRFVNSGVWYGPEEMDRSTTFTASVHEADPVAVLPPSIRKPASPMPAQQCPFACFEADEPRGLCKLSTAQVEV